MKAGRIFLIVVMMLGAATGCRERVEEPKVLRVAVIGGMVMSGMWEALAERFERDTGIKMEVVSTGPKEVIGPDFRKGMADAITMHSSDTATELVASGYGTNMRPWTRNELVILAPPGDPAGITGWKDGAAALRRIAESRSPFIDAKGAGKRIVAEKLWKLAGVEAAGEWVIKDESENPWDLLRFAESKGAYVLSGRIPVLFGKLPKGGMRIAVQGDPNMQRPYVYIEADRGKIPGARTELARKLGDYLTGPEGQKFLREFAAGQPDRVALFFPLQENP